MRLRECFVVCCSLATACGSGSISSSTTADGTSSTADTTTSSSSDETSSGEETGGETDDDACPVDPELGDYAAWLDGHAVATDFRESDGGIEWTQSCTVVSHSGSLAAGETIGLECIDAEGQVVEHDIELLAEIEGAPTQVPVEVGQEVELALWLRVWWSGTVAWTLRDAEQSLLLLSYRGPYWPNPEAIAGEFAPPLEHIAPLAVDVNMDVCPLQCPDDEDTTGGFAPIESCCHKDTALRLDLGDGAVQIQARSGGAIPGPAAAFGIVARSSYIDVECDVPDVGAGSYAFTVVAGG